MRALPRALAIVLACSLLFAGCDSLSLDPREELGSDAVWQDETLTIAYLNDVYSGTGYGFGDPMIAGLADEAKNTHGHGDAPMRLSNMTPTDRGLWDWSPDDEEVMEKFNWEAVYGSVRDLNIFLRNVEESEALEPSVKTTLLGEAYFLRAYFYHNIMRLYGGVPLIASTFELQGDLEQYQVARGSFEETINFIVADLDSAATRLSLEPRRQGAASQGAALALKCRLLVHAASDLFHNGPFDIPEVEYQGGSQQERWQRAKEACQAVIDLGLYSLEQTDTFEAYHALFIEGNESGTIWARYFTPAGGEGHQQALWVSPNGYNSWTGDAPTQQHVDAYEMADGSQFSWDDPQQAEHPYDNRDPRFYANILFNGADWRPRPSGLQGVDPEGTIQTGWYEMPNGNLRPGLDTREGPVQTWNGTKTGYNLKKFVARDIEPATEQAYTPWPHLRYAEVLLNYAEAAAELGEVQDALRALNEVRNRVGMPDVPAEGGTERTLLERIRQEREVELAFEEFRYFDVRRWMTAPEVYSEGGKGIKITGHLVDQSDPDAELLIDHYYDYEYEVIQVDQRQWNDKAYFLPISAGEIDRNPQLVQNPGYN